MHEASPLAASAPCSDIRHPIPDDAIERAMPVTLYHAITDGIRVTVRPTYSEAHSDAGEPRHVFVYRIRLENVGKTTAQLIWRHWTIHDDAAGDSEVEGEGVIGQQPVLDAGDVHEYESFCVLRGETGWMEGYYEFEERGGRMFRVRIPRFQLAVD
jgi:ApaG protein